MRVAVIYKIDKGNARHSAICDKLFENKKQFERLGHICDLFYLDHQYFVKLDNAEQKRLSPKLPKKICSLFWNEIILKYADFRGYDLLIFRYNIFAISSTWFYRCIRKKYPSAKVVIELPTYPYLYEFKNLLLWIVKWIEPKTLSKYVDGIWHLGEEKEVWHVPTIKYHTYIDINKYALKKRFDDYKKNISLISVSTLWPWFGIQDFIDAFIKYIKNNEDRNLVLHVVGDGPMYESLSKKIEASHSNKSIIMHGAVFSEELDVLFENADFAIGNFGRKYQPLGYAQSIKHRSYAARGIPFAYNTIDHGFNKNENVLFIDKESIDHSDIGEIVDWITKHRIFFPKIANELRSFVEKECDHARNVERLLKFLFK